LFVLLILVELLAIAVYSSFQNLSEISKNRQKIN
jgi:hypothetical protein